MLSFGHFLRNVRLLADLFDITLLNVAVIYFLSYLKWFAQPGKDYDKSFSVYINKLNMLSFVTLTCSF